MLLPVFSSSHNLRERVEEEERKWKRYKTAPGEIAPHRLCWQHAAAEINSVKRRGKHPSPAPLHRPLIWDDTQKTERRRVWWRLWLKKKEAVTFISWDIGTIIALLPVMFAQCIQNMNRQWIVFQSINVFYTRVLVWAVMDSDAGGKQEVEFML